MESASWETEEDFLDIRGYLFFEFIASSSTIFFYYSFTGYISIFYYLFRFLDWAAKVDPFFSGFFG